MNEVRIVLVGIGGYGGSYINALLKKRKSYPFQVVGAVDPFPENSTYLGALLEMNVPVYPTLEAFYAVSHADLAVISSPIQYHCTQTCLALSQGSNVLCEKPLCVRIDDAMRMISARDKAGKFVAIGYQWSYSAGIQALKKDIGSGLFGKPKRLKTILLWPRTAKYYARSWAGKKQDASGNMILDSVASNATAHYIHNMFYVLGGGIAESARPSSIMAELYRANEIENYDTAAMRAFTDQGVELLYYGSHAVNQRIKAMFHYEFELANIHYDEDQGSTIIANFKNGDAKEYENPNLNADEKLWSAIAATIGNGDIVCGPEAALSHAICINSMQESSDITVFPEDIVRRGETFWNHEKGCYVKGLFEQLKICYDKALLPSENGLDWAKAGKQIEVNSQMNFAWRGGSI